MKGQYLTLPLRLGDLTTKGEHPVCNLKQSVAQHLHLIITTSYGEMVTDEEFGCGIWEHDFDNLTSSHKIKELIRDSLQESVERYESRLHQVKIDLLISQDEFSVKGSGSRVKKKVTIKITGILIATNESFVYEDSFLMGPYDYQNA
ncbi:GPW/gp25 family protein [Cognataquiflexum rubidum]|uniref:GPW/gp25 family protein n=1 Tax=Cognataquiflexum rubidum TaxID=2922273 RepID=UPI001F1424C5|nr:GPW/gp25 family protein [Cognataquiflexum rubidum]MCH6234202.1 GPW/gp25 family protein [Cognataquiflexum rubidum]